MIQVIRDPI